MKEIDYDKIPESARQDILASTVRLAREAFKDPAVRARYQLWLEKRKAAEAAAK